MFRQKKKQEQHLPETIASNLYSYARAVAGFLDSKDPQPTDTLIRAVNDSQSLLYWLKQDTTHQPMEYGRYSFNVENGYLTIKVMKGR